MTALAGTGSKHCGEKSMPDEVAGTEAADANAVSTKRSARHFLSLIF